MPVMSPVTTNVSSTESQGRNVHQLGKDDFLQLLVTKLQNQDPMNPQSDEDFIAQLAQFSTLEQMENIAKGIEASNQWDYLQMQSINNTMAAGLIGREITADYSGVYVDSDNKPVISFTTTQDAQKIEFIIRDANNTVVATLTKENMDAGTGSIEWDGLDEQGNRVAEGYYTVEANATMNSGETFTPKLALVGIVTKITYREGAAFLMVNGTEVSMGDVISIAEPEDG